MQHEARYTNNLLMIQSMSIVHFILNFRQDSADYPPDGPPMMIVRNTYGNSDEFSTYFNPVVTSSLVDDTSKVGDSFPTFVFRG